MDEALKNILNSIKSCNIDKVFDIINELIKLNDDYFFHREISWSVPRQEMLKIILNNILDNDIVLEVGAGKGLWAGLLKCSLKDSNSTFYAIDTFSDEYNIKSGYFTEVEKMNAKDAITNYNPTTLLLIWPPKESDMAYETLTEFRGDKLIYIGSQWGHTANVRFDNMLKDKWDEIMIKSFDYVLDTSEFIGVYHRKKK